MIGFPYKLGLSGPPKLQFSLFGPSFQKVITMLRIVRVFILLNLQMSSDWGIPNIVEQENLVVIFSEENPVTAAYCFPVHDSNLFRRHTWMFLHCPLPEFDPQVMCYLCKGTFCCNVRVVICPPSNDGVQTIYLLSSRLGSLYNWSNLGIESSKSFFGRFGKSNIARRSAWIQIYAKMIS